MLIKKSSFEIKNRMSSKITLTPGKHSQSLSLSVELCVSSPSLHISTFSPYKPFEFSTVQSTYTLYFESKMPSANEP